MQALPCAASYAAATPAHGVFRLSGSLDRVALGRSAPLRRSRPPWNITIASLLRCRPLLLPCHHATDALDITTLSNSLLILYFLSYHVVYTMHRCFVAKLTARRVQLQDQPLLACTQSVREVSVQCLKGQEEFDEVHRGVQSSDTHGRRVLLTCHASPPLGAYSCPSTGSRTRTSTSGTSTSSCSCGRTRRY